MLFLMRSSILWTPLFYIVTRVTSDFTCNSYVAIDLTFMVNKEGINFIGSFTTQPLERVVDPFYVYSDSFSSPEHGGTHIDAPFHSNRYGPKLGQIPLDNLLLVDGVIIDVSHKTVKFPEYQLTAQDIRDWECQHGPLPPRCVVLVNFGWAHKYTNRTAYLGLRSEDDSDGHYPVIGADAARYLVAAGKVLGVGVDTISTDALTAFITHQILQGANLYILENVALDRVHGVPARGFKLIILPMRIEQGSGAPTHVVLMVDPVDYHPPRPFRPKLSRTDLALNIHP